MAKPRWPKAWVTTPAAAAQTLAIHQQAFDTPQLRDAWQRVIAMVVQPGVDFDHSSVHEYNPDAAHALADFLERQPRIVFEAHSTDYQRESGLHALVRDHFAILKVGPAATFATARRCSRWPRSRPNCCRPHSARACRRCWTR